MKQKGVRMMPNSTEPVGFETDIKPRSRERDRKSMEFAFDLRSRDDVSENADAILARTKAGTIGAELIQDRQGHSPYRAMGPTVPDGV